MIANRLKTIISYYKLSAAAFADSLGVQRSSLSHILNGRNKPSLDFVMKVDMKFPEVDLRWLLYGEGEFPKSSIKNPPLPYSNQKPTVKLGNETNKKQISSIVTFYEDGTFESFSPKE